MAHGEYKTPGGKLVVVDATIADHTLQQVMISGDFFLYPDEALEPMTASLEGLDISLDQKTITALIEASIPEGTEVLGTSAEGIAIAVRRAVDASTQEATSV